MDTKLNRLYKDVNTVLEGISKKDWIHNSSVNWTDFGIHSIEDVVACYDLDDKRHHFFRVWLSEASPGNRELSEYIAEGLRELSWEQVEIRMEW